MHKTVLREAVRFLKLTLWFHYLIVEVGPTLQKP